jgi:hypothetical protein
MRRECSVSLRQLRTCHRRRPGSYVRTATAISDRIESHLSSNPIETGCSVAHVLIGEPIPHFVGTCIAIVGVGARPEYPSGEGVRLLAAVRRHPLVESRRRARMQRRRQSASRTRTGARPCRLGIDRPSPAFRVLGQGPISGSRRKLSCCNIITEKNSFDRGICGRYEVILRLSPGRLRRRRRCIRSTADDLARGLL